MNSGPQRMIDLSARPLESLAGREREFVDLTVRSIEDTSRQRASAFWGGGRWSVLSLACWPHRGS